MVKDLKFLNFRIIPKKIKTETKFSKKLVQGECFIEDGKYRIRVYQEDGQYLVLDFTSDSFNLKGREVVFDAQPTSPLGKGIIYRREREYKHAPGLTSQYCAVCEGCVFSGYIVRGGLSKKLMFKLHKYVKHI